MNLFYKEEDNAKSILKLKDEKITYYKTKEFEKYKSEKENAGETVTVVRNTSLKKWKKDSDDEFLEINQPEYRYRLTKEKSSIFTKGYIPVSDNKYVRIVKKPYFLILFLPIIMYLLVFALKQDNVLPKLEMENAFPWNGISSDGESSQNNQETIQIPGYTQNIVSDKKNMITLYNPPKNTVNFVYTIMEEENHRIIRQFSEKSISMAQKYIRKHNIEYENCYNKSKYMVKYKNGKISDSIIKYSIVKNNKKYLIRKSSYKMLYFTKGIAPNKAVNWDAYESLSKGKHNLVFSINTYDTKTLQNCQGANQKVKIIVK